MNPTLFFQKNQPVQLARLKAKRYNRLYGNVLGFDESSQRYMVHIAALSKSIKVRWKNLLYVLVDSKNSKTLELLSIIYRYKADSSLGDLEPILDKMIGATDNINAADYAYLAWDISSVTMQTYDLGLVSKIQRMLQTALGLKPPEPQQAQLKIRMAQCYNILLSFDKCRTLLLSMKDRHFGFLPYVNMLLILILDGCEKILSLYLEIEPQLETGNYDAQFERYLPSMYCRVLDFADGLNVNFAKSLLSKVEAFASSSNCFYLLRAQAQMLMLENDYLSALQKCIEGQSIITKDVGNCSFVSSFVEMRARCYIWLQRKSLAQKAVEELKRLNYYPEDIVRLEEAIGVIDHIDNCKGKFKTICKCSNPKCENVEKSVGEFQKCSRCNIAKYCSKRCQKKHWNTGHKKHCNNLKFQ